MDGHMSTFIIAKESNIAGSTEGITFTGNELILP
jgi:hypothetical protein